MTEPIWRIYLADQCLGSAILSHHDEGMNLRMGTFQPASAYSQVQAVFRLFFEACQDPDLLQEYFRKRDALRLTIVDELGDAQAGTVHIVDCTEEDPDEPLVVEIYPC